MGQTVQDRISYFADEVMSRVALPGRFTFPFYYEPHPLARIAAAELQRYLAAQTGLRHNFGLGDDPVDVIGKMFGVLVVADAAGKTGYLWAFSGKLAGTNDHPAFVPPVFDMLTENSFFLQEQAVIDAVNGQIEALQGSTEYHLLKQSLERSATLATEEITALKQQLKDNKEQRRLHREAQKQTLDAQAYELLDAGLIRQSLHDKRRLKALTEKWDGALAEISAGLSPIEARIEALKEERKERSAILQERLFEQYTFLNQDGESRSLQSIFAPTAFGKPPAGAGECATPKLLQYALAHGYRPLAMAEFWWGASPRSEIRKHGQFYPACTGKCKPILEHMLHGIPIDDSPFLLPADDSIQLEIVYEDDHLLVVNKPAGLRSVPGVDIEDSVYSRLRAAMGGTEPLIVHRLDMGTSGLLVVAKAPDVHRHLQRQFLHRTVSKRYTALLSRHIAQNEGEIRLPLTADLFNRPRQLVCFDTGKKSITRWKVAERTATTTRIHFWPLTGRTHQLRVHSAHEQGLNAPIVGDDIYGTAAARLYLHAAQLAFVHPKTKQPMSFGVAEDF